MPSKTAKQTRHHPCVRCGLWEKNSQNAGSNRAKKLHRFQHWLARGIDLPVEWYEWCNIRCTLLVPEKGAPLLLRKMEHHPNNKLHSKIKYYVLNYYWLARNGSLILFPISPAFVSPPFPLHSPLPSPPPPFTKPALAGRAGFLFERYGSNDNNGNKNNNNNIKQ